MNDYKEEDLTLDCDETYYQDETELIPTEAECDRQSDFRDFARNHGWEDLDTEPEDWMPWSGIPKTDVTDRLITMYRYRYK